MPRRNELVPRATRTMRDGLAEQQIFLPVPDFIIFLLMHGKAELKGGNYEQALLHFNNALSLLPFPNWIDIFLDIVISRAECYLLMNRYQESLMDVNCTGAVDYCHKNEPPKWLFRPIEIRMKALELTDNIKEAFEMALLCETIHPGKGTDHVERLRQKLEELCAEDNNLMDEVRESLMAKAREFLNKELYFAAAVHLAAVINIVCKHVYVPEAYLYHAKCHLNMCCFEEARKSCDSVLKHDADNEECKAILKEITKQEKPVRRKNRRKKDSSSAASVQEAAPVAQKPAMNKKQRKQEQSRRMKEMEIVKAEVKEKMLKDQEKNEQHNKDKSDVDKARRLPSYDVKAAWEATGISKKDGIKNTKVQAAVTNNTRGTRKKAKKKTKEITQAKNMSKAGDNGADKRVNPNIVSTHSPKVTAALRTGPSLGGNLGRNGPSATGKNSGTKCQPNQAKKERAAPSNWPSLPKPPIAVGECWKNISSVPKQRPNQINSANRFQPRVEQSRSIVQRNDYVFSRGTSAYSSPLKSCVVEKEKSCWATQETDSFPFPKDQYHNPLKSSSTNAQPRGESAQHGTTRGFFQSDIRPRPCIGLIGEFKLCKWWKSNKVCRYGQNCTNAHGEEELKAWTSPGQQLNDYNTTCEDKRKESLSAPGQNILESEYKMVDDFPGVSISLEPPENVTLKEKNDIHRFQWTISVKFKVHEAGQLRQIVLFQRDNHCYRLVTVKVYLGNKELHCSTPRDRWSYQLPDLNLNSEIDEIVKVEAVVSFESTMFGTFTQCLGFGFGTCTYLKQLLNVDIGTADVLSIISQVRQHFAVDSSDWRHDSVEVVPSPANNASFPAQDSQLQKKYKLPDRIEDVVSVQVVEGNCTIHNYKAVMHNLLFVEEHYMKSEICRYVIQDVPLRGQKSLISDVTGMSIAENDDLFGILSFQDGENVNSDCSAGRLILRNVFSAWIRPSGTACTTVYEVLLEKVERELVVFKLPKNVCDDLQVVDGGDVFIDAQFQLNRQPLCDQHAAIDRLGSVQMRMLFPDSKQMQDIMEIPREVAPDLDLFLDSRLNESQKLVIQGIVASTGNLAPLVVFGPFGTGKTFTLNQAVRRLVVTKKYRILLCTHSHRAADIHVELLDENLTKGHGIQASKPLRIYQPMRRTNTASETVKKYCLIENNSFVLPRREDVTKHRVVVTTLATSQVLLELQLNHGFFTHILIDEAAQALEPEALIPLALAGPNTTVAFTGDHMQMSPEVYSQHARDWGLQRSLPERLFDYYSERKTNRSDIPNVIFLSENYRCHPDILQFPSDNFYGEKLIARSNEAAHPRLGPLLFFSARGKERKETDNSYLNEAEVDEVVKRVNDLACDWPQEWGQRNLSQIAVLSAYRAQVQAIRSKLRKEDFPLKDVTVDTIHNVQGQEFRALFISTVRTVHTCKITSDMASNSTSRFYLEFLSDPKLLNTAVTRAKSLVAVIGDPVSLCTIGDCRGNWWDFIKRCDDRNSLYGVSFEELKQERKASLAKIRLNPEAAPFVSKSAEDTNENLQTEASQEVTIEERSNHQDSVSTERIMSEMTRNEERPGESNSDYDSKELTVEEEDSDPSTSGEEFSGFSNDQLNLLGSLPDEDLEDESVFPRYMDAIIRALVKVCEEKVNKDGKRLKSSKNTSVASKPTNRRAAKMNGYRLPQHEIASNESFLSGDYQIRWVNGRHQVHLVDLGMQPAASPRFQRITAPSRHGLHLDPEILLRRLRDEPEKYLACTLRLHLGRFRAAYAVVPDTKTPDIRIKGRIRQAFDMDRLVIERIFPGRSAEESVQGIQGKIIGVLEHIISPHERSYVCEADYDSPGVMRPINKSVTKIVNLSESRYKGVPIYKGGGDGETISVEVMDEREALSGRYLFLVKFLQWRSDCVYPLGAIIRKIPKKETLKDSMEVLFAEHGIMRKFREDIVHEVKKKFPRSWSVPQEEKKSRRTIDKAFTIDPDNSMDLDDALSLEKKSASTYWVGIHIADVSFFVKKGSLLDEEAFKRCTSYYPGNGYDNIPMLPPELSENHCSLLPNENRLCLSVFVEMSEEGKTIGTLNVERTVVRSCCRLTYTEAQKVIDHHELTSETIPEDVKRNIQNLSNLAQKRREIRMEKGSLDHWAQNNDSRDFQAHELVEEMMILANEKIAEFLSERNPEVVPLRVQLPPKDHKLIAWFNDHAKFVKFSLLLHSYFSEKEISDLSDLAESSGEPEESIFKVQRSVWSVICRAAENVDFGLLQKCICNESSHPQLAVANLQFRRIQSRAEYVCKGHQPKQNTEHFSLRKRCYTHFTSPIRRYIDLEVHRLVKAFLPENKTEKIPSKNDVAQTCRRSTFARDNAKKFEKGCNRVHLAAQLKEKSRATTAFVSVIDKQAISLEISRKEDDHLTSRERTIPISNFNPFSHDPGDDVLVLKWQLRIYAAPKCKALQASGSSLEVQGRQIVEEMLSQQFPDHEKLIDIPGKMWQLMLEAVQRDDRSGLVTVIKQIQQEQQSARQGVESPPDVKGQPQLGKNVKSPTANEGHFYETSLTLHRYDVVHLQLSAHMSSGTLCPEVQLFKLNPVLRICLEHRKFPRKCFASTTRYNASRRRYASVEEYLKAWTPVLAMEAATGAVTENDGFTIERLEVQWMKTEAGREAKFLVPSDYCSTRQLQFHPGDFACVSIAEDEFTKSQTAALHEESWEATSKTRANDTSMAENDKTDSNMSSPANRNFWVGHCIIKKAAESVNPDKEDIAITMDLHYSSSNLPEGVPEERLNEQSYPSTLKIIHRSLPHRRMFQALCHKLKSSSTLVKSICTGTEPAKENFGPRPSTSLSIVVAHPTCELKPLNEYQEQAVEEALQKPFTLIQGPPGTGKTVTGVHIAYWFTKRNQQLPIDLPELESDDPVGKAPPQVMYCGPSNKSVDVVAGYLLQIPGLKIIRVYSTRIEEREFPIPNKLGPLIQATEDETSVSNDALKQISLHHMIRSEDCPYAQNLKNYEEKFDEHRRSGEKTEEKTVEEYCELIKLANVWALQESGAKIILCTCITAGRGTIEKCCNNIQQCIVDECGMCLEPESLVPITCSGARQVVLIGDHKQLQPIIEDNQAKSLGLNVSMFERLSSRAKLLELQYRMHPRICEFPSDYFYEGKLKTDKSVPRNDPVLKSFWPAHVCKQGKSWLKNLPIAFCHVEGEEACSAIRTAESNEQSKSNMKEVLKVAQVAGCLVNKYRIPKEKIAILSPYREQRQKLHQRLSESHELKDILVTTIAKSQGSEWDYVILSLVRSVKEDELESEPSLQWLRKHLGFLTDEHQMNVGLTRARKGLCIIGNKNLLTRHSMWQNLLDFYEKNNCLVDESWPWN